MSTNEHIYSIKKYYSITDEGRQYCSPTKAKTARGIVAAFEEAWGGDFYELYETINGVAYDGMYRGEQLPLEVRVWCLIQDGFIAEAE